MDFTRFSTYLLGSKSNWRVIHEKSKVPGLTKAEAVKQVTERGHGVVDVAKRLSMSDKSFYLWVRVAKQHQGVGSGENAALTVEVPQLNAELKSANEEREIF